MIRSSYLRVYQALSEFPADEATAWLANDRSAGGADASVARRWLVTAALPDRPDAVAAAGGAFVKEVDNEVFACPWRTRLRMLAGLLAFRDSLPDEVADAFVPLSQAKRAARELAVLGDRPDLRSHILHANWHVPLRWFVAFEGSERVLIEDKDGLRIRYETSLAQAHARLNRAVAILETSWGEDDVTESVRELLDWLEQFDGRGLVELDYASVSGMFPPDDLVADDSALETWACLEALEGGDLIRAGRLFSTLTERWAGVRVWEGAN